MRFDRCPRAWLEQDAKQEVWLLEDVQWFRERGVLPLAGGKLDQDPRWLEALAIVEHELANIHGEASRRAGSDQHLGQRRKAGR